jgi:hypothetical protein
MQNLDTETKNCGVSGYVSNFSSSTQACVAVCTNAAQAEMAILIAKYNPIHE